MNEEMNLEESSDGLDSNDLLLASYTNCLVEEENSLAIVVKLLGT